MMLSLTLPVLFGIQIAAEPPGPKVAPGVRTETWELEYDIAILPYIEDYRRCLNYGNRVARGMPDFEEQHRTDLPRCAEVKEESIAASNAALGRRGLDSQYPPDQVAETFYRLSQIHIERGRFIDDRFQQRQQVLAQYRADHAEPTAPLDQKPSEVTEEPNSNATNP